MLPGFVVRNSLFRFVLVHPQLFQFLMLCIQKMLSSRACRRGKRRLNKSTILISQYVLNEILCCLLSMSAVAVVGRGGGFNLSLPDYFRHNLENLGFTWYKPYQLRIIIRARRVIFKLSTFSTTFFFFPTPVPGIWLNN